MNDNEGKAKDDKRKFERAAQPTVRILSLVPANGAVPVPNGGTNTLVVNVRYRFTAATQEVTGQLTDQDDATLAPILSTWSATTANRGTLTFTLDTPNRAYDLDVRIEPGTSVFVAHPNTITTTVGVVAAVGPRSPNNISAAAWTNALHAVSSNDQYATHNLAQGGTTGPLSAMSFSMGVPGGGTIRGIQVRLERSKVGGGTVNPTTVQLLKAGAPVGTAKTDATDWPTADAVATYGTPTDLWGTTWTPAEINALGFGVRVTATEGGTAPVTVRIDHVQITVHIIS